MEMSCFRVNSEHNSSEVKLQLSTCIHTVSAQIIFGRDVDALWNPNADSKKVIRCLSLFTQSLWSMIFQPPFYKIYRNKIYRDMEEAFTVRIIIIPLA